MLLIFYGALCENADPLFSKYCSCESNIYFNDRCDKASGLV